MMCFQADSLKRSKEFPVENNFRINKHVISLDHPPYIVAEMSGNHDQSLSRALATVSAAAGCGVNAIKLQTYTPDILTLNLNKREFTIDAPKSPWHGKSLYELYQLAYTPWEWHEPIMKLAGDLGLECFSTPFDETGVDFLESLNVPCYKIASFELVDLPLIEHISSTGKPVIVSTGMATIAEIEDAIAVIKDGRSSQMALMKCSSAYPAEPHESNLRTIPHMRELFGCEVGLSDHTIGTGVAVASVAMGASMIEKHFTLSRIDGGVVSKFSLEPGEMAKLVQETRIAWQSLGSVSFGPSESEISSTSFRRSLYITEDMKKGQALSRNNFRSIRPGFGLPPKHFRQLMGKRVKADLPKGTALSWDLIY